MKFKYYLRGCGVGILFTALVLTISFHTRGGVMTDEMAMQRASELGMVMPDSTENIADTQENTENAEPVVKMENTQKSSQNSEKATEQDGNKTKEKTTKNNKDKDKNKNKEGDTEKSSEKDNSKTKDKDTEKNNDENEVIEVTVRRGEVCRELAEDLYEKGLVDDAEKFRKYMRDSGYDSNICIGTFKLNKGMTYAQIANVLVTKPE